MPSVKKTSKAMAENCPYPGATTRKSARQQKKKEAILAPKDSNTNDVITDLGTPPNSQVESTDNFTQATPSKPTQISSLILPSHSSVPMIISGQEETGTCEKEASAEKKNPHQELTKNMEHAVPTHNSSETSGPIQSELASPHEDIKLPDIATVPDKAITQPKKRFETSQTPCPTVDPPENEIRLSPVPITIDSDEEEITIYNVAHKSLNLLTTKTSNRTKKRSSVSRNARNSTMGHNAKPTMRGDLFLSSSSDDSSSSSDESSSSELDQSDSLSGRARFYAKNHFSSSTKTDFHLDSPERTTSRSSNDLEEMSLTPARPSVFTAVSSDDEVVPSTTKATFFDSDLEDDDIYSTKQVHVERGRLMREKARKLSKRNSPAPVCDLRNNIQHNSAKDNCVEIDVEPEIDLSDVVVKHSRRSNARQKKQDKIMKGLEMLSENLTEAKFNQSMNDSIDDVMTFEKVVQTISVRICWGATYMKFTLNKGEPFLRIYQQLAEQNGVPISSIVLSCKHKLLSPSCLPSDIGYTLGDTIEGGMVTGEHCSSTDNMENHPDMIQLKFQSPSIRDVLLMTVNKFEKFATILSKYAEKKNVSIARIKFRFDGEDISPDDTPFSTDLEGEECIDVFQL